MAALIVNAGARSGADLEEASQALRDAGIDVQEAHQVEPKHMLAMLRDLMPKHPLVIVGGGDGTINMAAHELAHTQTVLGILPMGTQNSFARSLGIPLDLAEAALSIASGRVRSIDLGQVGDRIFTHSVTIGVSTHVAQETDATFKRLTGQAAYMLVGSRVIASHEAFRCRFVADGQPRTLETHQVVITNGGMLGPADLAPDARPDDGRLHVATIGSDSRWEFVRGWAASVTNSDELPEGSQRFDARDLVLETEPPQQVDVDGEPGIMTPVHLEVLPGVLLVRLSS